MKLYTLHLLTVLPYLCVLAFWMQCEFHCFMITIFVWSELPQLFWLVSAFTTREMYDTDDFIGVHDNWIPYLRTLHPRFLFFIVIYIHSAFFKNSISTVERYGCLFLPSCHSRHVSLQNSQYIFQQLRYSSISAIDICLLSNNVLYSFFWVILRRLNFIWRRFGALFHLHRSWEQAE